MRTPSTVTRFNSMAPWQYSCCTVDSHHFVKGIDVSTGRGGTRRSEDQGNEPTEITFDEHLHPARPGALRFRPRVKAPFMRRSVAQDGPATGDNPAYVSWLLSQSMLADANEISQQFSGQGSMWQNPYATPSPRGAVDTASVWFTAYPLSLITRPDESFLKAMADEEMWEAFAEIGIEAIHTGPVKRAGGISGMGADAERGWALRPHQHPDRPGVRHRGRIPRRCAVPRTGTAARSSTTSCPATPARAPTSGWPR